MRTFVGFGIALGLLFGFAPTAATAGSVATVQPVQGKVLLDRGAGFVALGAATRVEPGNRVMASANSKAKVTYGDGCTVQVAPGSVVSVGVKSPCTAASLAGLDSDPNDPRLNDPRGSGWGAVPLILGVTAAGVAYCISGPCNDDDGGSGRRRRASP